MGSGARKPETWRKTPTFLLPEPINSDVFGKTNPLKPEENPKKTRRKPDFFGTRPEPRKWYRNLTGTRLLLLEPITMHDRDGMMTLFLLQEMALNEVLAFLQKSSIKVERPLELFGEFKIFGGKAQQGY